MRRTSVSVVAATGFTIKEKQFMVTSWKKRSKMLTKDVQQETSRETDTSANGDRLMY